MDEEDSANLCGLNRQVPVDYIGFILALPRGDLALIWRPLAESFWLLRSGRTVNLIPHEKAPCLMWLYDFLKTLG